MKTLLTVDWDFFCKEDPAWDLGHRENLLFLKMLWSGRAGLVDVMKTTGDEICFWSRLREQCCLVPPLWVSDSHCYAYSLLKGVSRVVLFDAHHDCWKSQKDEKGQIMCNNWLRVWLKGSKRRKATWVQPGWLDKRMCCLPEDMEDRVEVVDWQEGVDLGLEGSVAVHACRSGCWTPPWLDKAFLDFLGGFGVDWAGILPMQDGEWNPLKERWSEEDLKQALAAEAEVWRLVVGMTVGSIPSSTFAGAMVEKRL